MRRLRVIKPVFTTGGRKIADLRPFGRDGVQIERTLIEDGPSSIESAYEEMLAAPGVVAAALRAQDEGCEAVLIDCFGDPGLQATREALDIPAFGAGECSMQAAAMLSHRFSIVTVLPGVVPMVSELAHRYGVSRKLASIRVIDIPVLALGSDSAALQDAMGLQALKAVRDDGAQAIVLGCTGFAGCAEGVADSLARHHIDVPVIDPVPISISMALAFCDARLKHSKLSWMTPPHKPAKGFDRLSGLRRIDGPEAAGVGMREA